MHELIQTLYGYNSWATERLLQAVKGLSPQEYIEVEASGHGSIRDTLIHLLAVQWGWFSWFDKSTPMAEAYARTAALQREEIDIDTVDEAVVRWRTIDEQTRRCIERLDAEQLREIWSWTFPNGSSGALPLWQMVLHGANHQTHTRAQIVAAIRRAGHDPGVYEFLAYALAQGNGE